MNFPKWLKNLSYGLISILTICILVATMVIIFNVSFDFGNRVGFEFNKFYSGHPYSYFEYKSNCNIIATNIKQTEETFIIPTLFGSKVLIKKEWNIWSRKGDWMCLYKLEK